jgi:hypothetical protein
MRTASRILVSVLHSPWSSRAAPRPTGGYSDPSNEAGATTHAPPE